MISTASKNFIPVIPQTGDYVFVLEDLELAFPADHLKEITKMWNDGASAEFIAKQYRRDPDEIFLALFHQARKGRTKRRFKV